jgi:transcriptional regulator with XRE-family HTH domain
MENNIINLKYLEEYMIINEISQKELAKIIGVNYTTVYRVFKGDRNPGAKFISGLLSGKLDIDKEKIFFVTK